jgi:hypothetical protein
MSNSQSFQEIPARSWEIHDKILDTKTIIETSAGIGPAAGEIVGHDLVDGRWVYKVRLEVGQVELREESRYAEDLECNASMSQRLGARWARS